MRRISTAARLSIGLVALTLSVLSSAQFLGIYRDPTQAVIDGRLRLCEALGVHCAAAVQNNLDVDNLGAVISSMSARNDQVLSVGVRLVSGELMLETDDHEKHWKDAPEQSTPRYVRVPIIRDGEPWGTVEVSFEPLYGSGFMGWLMHPVFGMMIFMGVSGFLAYLFYLRRTLKALNPQAVIPQRIQGMLNTLTEGVVVIDKNEHVVLANEAFARDIGRTPEELQGELVSKLGWITPESGEGSVDFPWRVAMRDESTQVGVGLRFQPPEGEARTLMVNAAPILGGDGKARGVLATFDDVSAVEKKNAQLSDLVKMLKKTRDQVNKQNEELQRLATRDALTGCLNRRSLFERFESMWNVAEQTGKDLGCIMFDIDKFKSVNDTHGHAVGDQVLREVAEVLHSLADEMDIVCRYGGEEFCVLIPHGDVAIAAEKAEKLRVGIEERHCGGLDITSSFGASAKSFGAANPTDLLEQADQALYAAKHGGRNQVVRWDAMPEKTDETEEATVTSADDTSDDGDGTFISFHAVTGLLAALSQRDPATGQHSRRVADLCVAVAKDMMSPRDLFILESAALLHDLGKLGIPDSILLKNGPLTDEQWSVMRLHEDMGVSIINATFASKELTEVVRTHHAWFGGHPSELDLPKGTDIPDKARILAIADAFDAMVSDRPYRKGMSRQKAFEQLHQGAGTQFDPDLIDPFIKAVCSTPESESAAPNPDTLQYAILLDQAVGKLSSLSAGGDAMALLECLGQLKLAAARRGLGRVVELVSELEEVAVSQDELSVMTPKVTQLLEMCQLYLADPDDLSQETSGPQDVPQAPQPRESS